MHATPLRSLARLVALTAVCALTATGCTSTGSVAFSGSPTGSATPTTNPSSGVVWLMRGGDAWAWREHVAARCECGGDCEEATVTVGGAVVQRIRLKGDRISANVPLRPGENEVLASCSTAGGERLSSEPLDFTERLGDRPTARIGVSLGVGGVVLDAGGSSPSHDGHRIVSYRWSARPGNPGRLLLPVHGRSVVARPLGPDGEYYLTLTVKDDRGAVDRSTTYFVVSAGQSRVVDLRTENPEWVDKAVVYGTVPFLFGSDGFKSIERKLPYLQRLGINTIWLSPVNRSPLGDYGYAVKDYFSLNPNYGTKADFRELVDAAHAHGIRVLMDLVPNHTSDQHPYFRDALTYGKASHYYDFYDRKPDGTYTHYFDWTNLPNLNYDNREVRRMILAAFSYWVRRFNVDGFRVDAAWGVKRRDPSFWPKWRMELKRIKPDLLLLAEASARDPYYFSHGFDAAYDWTEHLGQWAWQGIFDSDTTIAPYLDAALTDLGHGYPHDALVFRFLNNNDTGQRFMSQYGTDKTRVAAALLLTLPGIPELFTGDEVGAEYLPYSDENPIQWKDEFNLRRYYRRLIDLRETWPALHSRDWQILGSSPTTTSYAYVRFGLPGQAPTLVVLNFGDRGTVDVPIPGRASVFGNGRLRDLLNGGSVRTSPGALRVRMQAWSARILVPEGATP